MLGRCLHLLFRVGVFIYFRSFSELITSTVQRTFTSNLLQAYPGELNVFVLSQSFDF